MKNSLRTVMLVFVLFVMQLPAQKRPTPVMPSCAQGNMIPYWVVINTITFPICVIVDSASFQLDLATNPPRLRIVPQPGATWVYSEAPVGVIDGVNATFTLSAPPNPPASLELRRNGMTLAPATDGSDYTLSGATITYTPASIPRPGDSHFAKYQK